MVGTSGFTDVEELLSLGVKHDCGGHTWITSGSGGPTKALNILMADHTLFCAPLPSGIDGSVAMAMVFFKRPKDCGHGGVVSLESVYTYLGLSSAGGKTSKWINKYLQKWSHFIGQLFPGDHLLARCHHGKGEAHSATPFHKTNVTLAINVSAWFGCAFEQMVFPWYKSGWSA